MVAVTDEERLGTGCETGGISLTFVVTGVPSASARVTGDPRLCSSVVAEVQPQPCHRVSRDEGLKHFPGVDGTLRDVCFVFRKWSNFLFSTRAHEVSCGVCKHSAPAIDSWRGQGQKVKVGGV